jgi:hypothetical protein
LPVPLPKSPKEHNLREDRGKLKEKYCTKLIDRASTLLVTIILLVPGTVLEGLEL